MEQNPQRNELMNYKSELPLEYSRNENSERTQEGQNEDYCDAIGFDSQNTAETLNLLLNFKTRLTLTHDFHFNS